MPSVFPPTVFVFLVLLRGTKSAALRGDGHNAGANRLCRSGQSELTGRLFVQTKKTRNPKRGWKGISISVDATAVVRKDSVTRIVRARSRQEKTRRKHEE